eukprot:3590391-Amphidinium_carterae.2
MNGNRTSLEQFLCMHPSIFDNMLHAPDATTQLHQLEPVHGVVRKLDAVDLEKLDATELPLYHRVQMPVDIKSPGGDYAQDTTHHRKSFSGCRAMGLCRDAWFWEMWRV